MIQGLVLAATWLTTSACVLVDRDEVVVSDGLLRLRDVATLDCVAPGERSNVGAAELAALPAGKFQRSLSAVEIVRLVTLRLPEFPLADAGKTSRSIKISSHVAAAPPAGRVCWMMAKDLAKAGAVTRDAVAATSCAPGRRGRIVYDRPHGVVRAASDLEAGDYLGPLPQLSSVFPDAGSLLTLQIAAGALIVEKDVVALQPGSRGQALFVQDEDGNVLRAPLPHSPGDLR